MGISVQKSGQERDWEEEEEDEEEGSTPDVDEPSTSDKFNLDDIINEKRYLGDGVIHVHV